MAKNLQIRKSNALVEAGYRLTLGEHRIILACIAQTASTPINDQTLYEVDALGIAQLAGITRQTAYEEISEAASRLFDRYITVPYDQAGGVPVLKKFRWVQQIEYVNQLGLVRLQFTAALIPYLAELTERFTAYPIVDVVRMTSTHAIRLYELLVQWRSVGRREIEIDWLKSTFQISENYKSISDLKRWVIEPAVQQINQHSPIDVVWTQRKTGRKVTHLCFTFRPKKEKVVKKNSQPKMISEAEASELARPGETWSQLEKRLNVKLIQSSLI